MLEQILQNKNLIFYVLASEVLILCLFQLRTNILLKRIIRLPAKKRETAKQQKEEVKKGTSEIPVVKFEKPKTAEKKKQAVPEEKEQDMGADEMAVLQELMTEFFG